MTGRRLLTRTVAMLFLGVFALSGSGCEQPIEEAPPPAVPKVSESNADLVIALLPERNVFEQKKKYLPLQEYLTEKLGISVYFKLLDNYELIFAELLEGKVDGGFWGSMNGAIVQTRGVVEMLARPEWPDGTSTYNGYVYTTKGSGITSDPASWRGRSVAFVNKATTAGFLFPLSLLHEAGITEDPSDFFEKAIFSGSHDASILAVFQGEVDMGASKNIVYNEFIAKNPEVGKNLVILAESQHVPSNALGVRPSLPSQLKSGLKQALVSMADDPAGQEVLSKFGALRFIETSFDDYRPVFEMAERTSIDLAQWPLRDTRGARPYR